MLKFSPCSHTQRHILPGRNSSARNAWQNASAMAPRPVATSAILGWRPQNGTRAGKFRICNRERIADAAVAGGRQCGDQVPVRPATSVDGCKSARDSDDSPSGQAQGLRTQPEHAYFTKLEEQTVADVRSVIGGPFDHLVPNTALPDRRSKADSAENAVAVRTDSVMHLATEQPRASRRLARLHHRLSAAGGRRRRPPGSSRQICPYHFVYREPCSPYSATRAAIISASMPSIAGIAPPGLGLTQKSPPVSTGSRLSTGCAPPSS